MEVASLDATVSFEDARSVVVDMLTEQGVAVDNRSHDPYSVRLDAFGARAADRSRSGTILL